MMIIRGTSQSPCLPRDLDAISTRADAEPSVFSWVQTASLRKKRQSQSCQSIIRIAGA